MTIEVTVVIVSYNSGPFLLECVQRVLDSFASVQVLVSDNGSTDASVQPLDDLAQKDQRLHVQRNDANLGFARGNNVVLPLAEGRYVLFLNPDCLVSGDVLARMLEVFAGTPNAGLAGCLIRNQDGTVQETCRRKLPTPGRLLGALLSRRSIATPDKPLQAIAATAEVEAISGAFMLTHRDLLEKLGTFDERYFMHWEDLDLCARYRRAGYRVMFVPDVEVVHIKGQSSRSTPCRIEWFKHLGMAKFLHKFHFPCWPWPVFLAVALPVWLHFLVRCVVRRK